MGGQLGDKPTFIVNFRLPWGVLLAYFEIPERFLPFVRAGYEPDFDKSTLPSLNKMSSSDRCVARFLQGSNEHKNSTLKIVPVVVEAVSRFGGHFCQNACVSRSLFYELL